MELLVSFRGRRSDVLLLCLPGNWKTTLQEHRWNINLVEEYLESYPTTSASAPLAPFAPFTGSWHFTLDATWPRLEGSAGAALHS